MDVDAKAEIDRLTDSFFALFSNRESVRPDLGKIFDLFVPNGLIAKCTGPDPEISTLHDFIAPRQELRTFRSLRPPSALRSSATSPSASARIKRVAVSMASRSLPAGSRRFNSFGPERVGGFCP
jgi:hypothetical protein